MAILAGDIKLVASLVMDDVDEGGGPPSSHIIVDGTSNGIFNDISELDRAIGRVNLRKVFAEVRTANVDGYFGANVIVADPPDDPAVAVSLFATRDTFDTRADAKLRIESYLSQGPAYGGYLYGDHIAGQGAIILLQRKELAPPSIGDTLVLLKNPGLSSEAQQFVRATSVSSRLRKFADEREDEFERLEVTLILSDTLRYDFPGFPAIRQDAVIDYTGKTRLYSSIVADAARYYGVVPLELAASLGDFTLKAASIFTQIVPSTRTEVPIADARLNQQANALIGAGGELTQVFTLAFTTTQALFIGASILPGSLTITRAGITVTDKGGLLVVGDTQVGVIDYDSGVASLSSNVFGSAAGAHTVTYDPATTPLIVSETIGVPVSQQGQRLTWVISLEPIPTRRTLQVSYRAQGKWYVLSEDGSGAVRGADSAFGAGTLNFSTGTVSLTLGALPDVGSQIVLTWVPAVAARSITAVPPLGPAVQAAFRKTFKVTGALKPGAIALSWNDGTARSASDAGGVLTGDASGPVNYGEGSIEFLPTVLPPKGTEITLTTTNVVQETAAIAAFGDGGSTWTFTLDAPIKTRSVDLALAASLPVRGYPGIDHSETRVFRLLDDGAGNLQLPTLNANLTVGSINYSTGACTLSKTVAGFLDEQPLYVTTTVLENTQIPALDGPTTVPTPVTKISHAGFEQRSVTLTLLNGSTGLGNPGWAWWGGSFGDAAKARWAGADDTGETYHFTFDEAFMPVVAGTVSEFTLKEPASLTLHRFVLQQGTLQYMHNPAATTGVGTVMGAVGVVGDRRGVLLTDWPAPAGNLLLGVPANLSGGTTPAVNGVTSLMLVEGATFRTAVAPLFNGGFSISGIANTYSADPTVGTPFTVSPDSNGVINGSMAVGKVDYETGIVTVRFGTAVADPGPGIQDVRYLRIPDVNYLQPAAVQADSLRYNAVGYSYIPLDAAILGLDPVRLPPDGRVPIFRQGTVAVVGHTGTVGPATVSNGQTLNCGRVRLSRVRVLGSDGAVINDGYTADLEAGTVTFTDVTGYAQPVTVEHRIEDMALVSDAQINGQITLTKPLTHGYPLGSYISSAVLAGDMHARVPLSFDQNTWSNVWSDDLIGSAAGGTYDSINHPLQVTNQGALTERWACVFTNTTTFNVIGEHIGQIATGNTGSACAPLNAATGMPYFTIESAGWGAGWVPGNVLRFNTVGAEFPVWAIRSILQSEPTVDSDAFTLLVRGDVDNP
jgi:hypothetical protein